METARNERKERVRFVISDAMDKTRVVELERAYRDPLAERSCVGAAK